MRSVVKVFAQYMFPNFRTRLLVRRLVYFPIDTLDYAFHRRAPITPPRGLWFVGGEDYKAINEEFLAYFEKLCGLKPYHHVLDVGCGVGVMASRLTSYLNADGSYFGFDIVRPGIAWCQKQISPRYPNFKFVYADVFHEQYNPTGKLDVTTWSFPCSNNRFDFTWLKSVFTHMTPKGIQHYLEEIQRVLKPGGVCLATLFFLNPESESLIQRGLSSLPIRHAKDGYSVLDLKLPELAVGIPEVSFRPWCEKVGLIIADPGIRHGSWCGRTKYISYQDIVVLTKPA